MMHRFIVVSGIPGCGKSTLGEALAENLDFPYLDKDAILERLLDEVGCFDEKTRHRLSRAADRKFEITALSLSNAVLDSFWRHPRAQTTSGTSSTWLTASDVHTVEILCSCAPELAATRYLDRKRHPGHLDSARSHSSLVAQSLELVRMLPLGVGPLIAVDTTDTVDTSELAERVRIALDV
jgi:predicted kinase